MQRSRRLRVAKTACAFGKSHFRRTIEKEEEEQPNTNVESDGPDSREFGGEKTRTFFLTTEKKPFFCRFTYNVI